MKGNNGILALALIAFTLSGAAANASDQKVDHATTETMNFSYVKDFDKYETILTPWLARSHEVRESGLTNICLKLPYEAIVRLSGNASLKGMMHGCQLVDIDPDYGDYKDGLIHHHPQTTGDVLPLYEQETADNPTLRDLSPDRVHLVAANEASGNFLMRGNMPISGDSFQYDELKATLRAKNAELPDDFYIIDVSLINDIIPAEDKHLNIERKYWEDNSAQGELLHHAIFGNLANPDSVWSVARKKIDKEPSIDKLDDLVNQINSRLLTKKDKPVVIYVHCEAGKDRTGEVIAAWRMRFEEKKYQAVLDEANQIAGRDIEKASRYGLKWYAWKLKDHKGMKPF